KVFDDSVMYDDYPPGAITMRVRILFGGTAMSGPAGVPHAISPIQRPQSDGFFEIAQFSLCSTDVQLLPPVNHSNAGGIIATILQLSEAIQNYAYNLFISHVTHDSAHLRVPPTFSIFNVHLF